MVQIYQVFIEEVKKYLTFLRDPGALTRWVEIPGT